MSQLELNYAYYNYYVKNYKTIFGILAVVSLIFCLFALLFKNKFVKVYEKPLTKLLPKGRLDESLFSKNIHYIIISIILIVVISFLILRTKDYKTYGFDEVVPNDIDEEYTEEPSVGSGDVKLEKNQTYSNKFKATIKFYVKSISNKSEIIMYGKLLDRNGNSFDLYNPIVYIAPNTTDLFIEMRNNKRSKNVYDIFNYNDEKFVENDDDQNLILDNCVNECSKNDNCLGILHGGPLKSNVCRQINDETTRANITSDLNPKDSSNYYKYLEKNSNLFIDDGLLIGQEFNYNNSCFIKNVPLSQWITLTLYYDHNNYYLELSYKGSKTLKKMCNFDGYIYEATSDKYSKIQFYKSDDHSHIEKKDPKVKSNVY